MPDVTKPVVLDETGQLLHPKIDVLQAQIEATVAPFEAAVAGILEEMSKLDIIYYVEN